MFVARGVVGLLVLCGIVSCVVASGNSNSRPVIGVVTQPRESNWSPSLGTDYIAASYIKFVEAAGAQAAVIRYDGDLEAQYESVDAVLFPGGGQDLDTEPKLLQAAQFFVDKSIADAKRGITFPVFGHCQGFELITMVATGLPRSQCMTTKVWAENISLPLHFVNQKVKTVYPWFAQMSPRVTGILESQPSTINMHSWSITPDMWSKFSALDTSYVYLSTSVDPSRNESSFVSTFQHRSAPVFAMQFHSEKVIFEWTKTENICHSYDCVKAMSFFVDFVSKIVRSDQRTKVVGGSGAALSIFNYSPVLPNTFSSFDQIYFFNN